MSKGRGATGRAGSGRGRGEPPGGEAPPPAPPRSAFLPRPCGARRRARAGMESSLDSGQRDGGAGGAAGRWLSCF